MKQPEQPLYASKNPIINFIVHYLLTTRAVLGDMGIAMLFVIAPLIYGLYYPYPYSTQIVRNIPVAIVDNAHGSLSREIIRSITASPSIKIQIVSDEREAKKLLLNNEVMAMAVIPANLQRRVITGKSVTINMIGHGGYVLASKTAQQAIAGAVSAISKDIEYGQLASAGLDSRRIEAIQQPVPLQIDPLYNNNEGYGSYVVTGVAWLILQQTLMIGCAMMIGTWAERNQSHAPPSVWLARVASVSLIHYPVCFIYTGLLFSSWGYETGANVWGNVVLIAIFSPSVAIIGFLLGLLINDRERSMQLLIFSALPIYFMSGYSWPLQQLPEALQIMRWVMPSTSAINAGTSFNQIGGTINENFDYLFALVIIAFTGLIALLWLGREKST